MKKFSLFCVLFVLCLTALIVPCCAAGVTPPEIPSEGDVWDGVSITQPSKLVQKDGVYYYEISTCAELAYVAQIGGDWLGRNYLLANNLIRPLDLFITAVDAKGQLVNQLQCKLVLGVCVFENCRGGVYFAAIVIPNHGQLKFLLVSLNLLPRGRG